MADNFDVITGNTTVSFADAKQAGAAFFKADVSQRPYVVHTPKGGSALAIAGTTVLTPPGGETTFVKFLPPADSYAISPDFRHGYNEAGRSGNGRDTVNSIGDGDEPAPGTASPVRVGQWPKSAPPPAAELMRLYVKEGSRYSLHMESDFQSVVKEAEAVYSAGKDVLVNEKANPQLVHVKSNLYNDVDVGREISPAEQGGVFIKGKGEILLDSFYEKLPLVDRTSGDRTAPQSREPLFPAADITRPASGPHAPEKAPANPGKAAPVVLNKEEAEPDAGKESSSKPILKKSGYELPAHLAEAYTVKSGRFLDKASDKVQFEDHGKKLSTSLEDKTVIAHMVDVAVAKKWEHLELTGTLSFRQMAWLETESRGIRTTGYEPTKQDLQHLAQLKNERGTSDPTAAKNQMEYSAERQVEGVAAQAKEAERSAPEAGQAEAGKVAADRTPTVEQAGRSAERAGDKEEPAQEKGEQTAPKEQGGLIVGRLVAHGRDNFNHDPDEKPSYFVTLETDTGERKIWGKDLERSMSTGVFEKGDAIWLERQGALDVTVEANVRDGQNKVVGKEEIAARKNVWDVKPAGLAVIRERSPEERVAVEAAYKVLEQEMQQYPAGLRREIVQRFTDSVAKGEVELPTPQVAEKQTQPEKGREQSREPVNEPAPEVEMERGG